MPLAKLRMIRTYEDGSPAILFPDWVKKPTGCKTKTNSFPSWDRHGMTLEKVTVVCKGHGKPGMLLNARRAQVRYVPVVQK